MIRITVELIPHGIGKPKHLGTMVIGNILSGTRTQGDYFYKMFNKAGHRFRNRKGTIKSFPRERLLVWDLLYRILRKEFGERNEDNSN